MNLKAASCLGLLATLTLTASNPAVAQEAIGRVRSWNLSRYMQLGFSTNPTPSNTNPSPNDREIWEFLTTTTLQNPANYQRIHQFSSPCVNAAYQAMVDSKCWQGPLNQNIVLPALGAKTSGWFQGPSLQGLTFLHPTVNKAVVLRWKSPIDGYVSILGRISDGDPNCGNGIKWFVDRENLKLLEGTLNNGNATSFNKGQIPVSIGTSLFFIVDSNGNQDCDTTFLDLLIVAEN
jgi:hypothetical protein